MFGASSNPYTQEADYMDQIPDIQQQYLGPYTQMGQNLLPQLMQGYGTLALHPGQVQAGMGSSFQADPGYQWQVDQALQAQNQAMAAGGMAGSPESQQFAEQTGQQMANQSYNDYMRRQMALSGAGMQGLQGLEGQGFQSAQDQDRMMTNYLYNRANLAGAQAQNRRNMMMGGMGMGTALGMGMIS